MNYQYNSHYRILLLEPNPADAQICDIFLRNNSFFSYDLVTRSTLRDGLAELRARNFDLVITELGFIDRKGVEIVAEIKQTNAALPLIVFTGQEDEYTPAKARRAGASEYLVKGCSKGKFVQTVHLTAGRGTSLRRKSQ